MGTKIETLGPSYWAILSRHPTRLKSVNGNKTVRGGFLANGSGQTNRQGTTPAGWQISTRLTLCKEDFTIFYVLIFILLKWRSWMIRLRGSKASLKIMRRWFLYSLLEYYLFRLLNNKYQNINIISSHIFQCWLCFMFIVIIIIRWTQFIRISIYNLVLLSLLLSIFVISHTTCFILL